MKIETYFIIMNTGWGGTDIQFAPIPDKFASEQEAEWAITDFYSNYPPSGGLAPDENPEDSFPKLFIRKILRAIR